MTVQLNRDWVIGYEENIKAGVKVSEHEARFDDTLHCGQRAELISGVYVFDHPANSDIQVHVPESVVKADRAFDQLG